ncbi:MAG TPA: hypothetical protein VK145_00050 [Candidatus Nanoarchaeia archaeon]|nr:hypothetical protein [Candidatus Nanoarchaeia archaeon]
MSEQRLLRLPEREDDGKGNKGLFVFHPSIELVEEVEFPKFVEDVLNDREVLSLGAIKIVTPSAYKPRPDNFIKNLRGTKRDTDVPIKYFELKTNKKYKGVLDHFKGPEPLEKKAETKKLSSFFYKEQFRFDPVQSPEDKVIFEKRRD